MALAGDHVKVFVDGYDLTADHNAITIADARELLDVTSFGDAVHKFIAGKRNIAVSHAGYMNASSGQSHDIMNAANVEGVVSVVVGDNTDPALGDIMYSISTRQGGYQTGVQIGQFIPFGSAFATVGVLGGWGNALAVGASFTNTSTGTQVDNSAATTSGGAAFCHVTTEAASDSYTIIVEGSTSGAWGGEETTLATFTLDAQSLDSECIEISGTIPHYTRYKATRTGSTGDTVVITVGLVRY